ncbi:MAG: sulfur oxidation c-type cytochrome SoxA [Rubrivivax sp.]
MSAAARGLARVGLAATLAWASTSGLQAGDIPPKDRRSGIDDTTPSVQAMQRDDMSNPGMLAVLDGEALWDRPAGDARKACRDCHGSADRSMPGVAARYPSFDTASGRVVDLQGRIQSCRTRHQRAEAFALESPPLLALVSHVALQSRGMPVAPPDDPRLAPHLANGQSLWTQRMGQLNFSCSQCHDTHWGARLGPALIPQGHPIGYPIYRLEWQTMGSLQRRFRNCMSGTRAEPYAYGSPEFVDLELYLTHRARGMAMETPGVRP